MNEPIQTGMSLSQTEDWPVRGHTREGSAKFCDHLILTIEVKARRVGWLDQRGNVWLSDKDWMAAGSPNGSITPLLIAVGCD